MDKTSCILLLISVQFMLYSVTTARNTGTPSTNVPTTDPTDTPATRRFVKRNADYGRYDPQCSVVRSVSIDFPECLHDGDKTKRELNRNGNIRTTECSSKNSCKVVTEMNEPCYEGHWKFIVYSMSTKNVTQLVVRNDTATIFSVNMRHGEPTWNDETRFDIQSNHVTVDFKAINAKDKSEVKIWMDACCTRGERAVIDKGFTDGFDDGHYAYAFA